MSALAEALGRFEAGLDPRHPERSAEVVGYGEISTVFAVAALDGVVVKRMAGFRSAREVDAYVDVVRSYVAALGERGVDVVPTEIEPVEVAGRRAVYLVQPRLPAGSIGNAILKVGSDDDLRGLVREVLARVRRVWEANAPALELGLDAQISNWAWRDRRPVLLDVSTPIVRAGGREVMDPELVLRSMPRPLAWAFEKIALPSLLERYHRAREVAKDLAANFIKEGRADRLGLALHEINAWLRPADGAPLTEKEVRKAYSADARLWTAFQAVRQLDRAFTTRVLRRRYEYILPGPVER